MDLRSHVLHGLTVGTTVSISVVDTYGLVGYGLENGKGKGKVIVLVLEISCLPFSALHHDYKRFPF